MSIESVLQVEHPKAMRYYRELKPVNNNAALRMNSYANYLQKMVYDIHHSDKDSDIEHYYKEIDITVKKIEDTYRKEVI